jgi:ketosteroid isomerase-like protein
MRNLATVLVVLAGAVTACGPKRLPGTSIEDTEENHAILGVIGQYRAAYEARDAQGVLKLISPHFYETNGTPDPGDDYDATGLGKNLEAQFKAVSAPALDLDIRRIDVKGDDAVVNYYYTARFQLADAGPQSGFKSAADVAQIHLHRESGSWKITSGI